MNVRLESHKDEETNPLTAHRTPGGGAADRQVGMPDVPRARDCRARHCPRVRRPYRRLRRRRPDRLRAPHSEDSAHVGAIGLALEPLVR